MKTKSTKKRQKKTVNKVVVAKVIVPTGREFNLKWLKEEEEHLQDQAFIDKYEDRMENAEMSKIHQDMFGY